MGLRETGSCAGKGCREGEREAAVAVAEKGRREGEREGDIAVADKMVLDRGAVPLWVMKWPLGLVVHTEVSETPIGLYLARR